MLSSFWNLNKYIIISREEYAKTQEKYVTDEYAVFEFTGEVIYREYDILSYNISAKDLSQLSSSIK